MTRPVLTRAGFLLLYRFSEKCTLQDMPEASIHLFRRIRNRQVDGRAMLAPTPAQEIQVCLTYSYFATRNKKEQQPRQDIPPGHIFHP